LHRAAEISSWVVENLNQMTTEVTTLALLTEIEKEFEEVSTLKQALHFGYKESDIKIYEHEIKFYASEIFMKDMVLSATFLHDASKPDMTIQELCLKYPDFCKFIISSTNPEKAQLLSGLQQVSGAR
jgi:hypothetical protein